MVTMKGSALILICAFAYSCAFVLNDEEEELNAVGCPYNFTIHKVLPHDTYCNLFYTCDRGVKVEQKCPLDLVFNSESDVCDWQANVECGEKEIKDITPDNEEEEVEEENNPGGNNDPSLAPEICALENSTGVLVAHENCSRFYKCEGGEPMRFDCPEGLLYHSEVGYCDWPANVDCGNRTRPEEAESPALNPACASDDTNLLVLAHENCNRFYKCFLGVPIPFNCPRGLVYNTELYVCDWQTNVDCGNRTIAEEEEETQ